MPPEVAKYLLVLHGLFGCDTTSGFYRHHSIFSNWGPVTEQLQVFIEPDSTKEQIETAGQCLVAHRYKCVLPLNLVRKKLYSKKCSNRNTKKEVNLATLPPTKDACNLHCLRAYHQIHEWRGHALSPLDFGWAMIGDELHPLPTTQDPAPKSLVDIPQCGCSKSKCSNNQCRCRSKNEYCSDICTCTCVGCENILRLDDNVCSSNTLNDSLLDDDTEDDGEDGSDDEDQDDYDDEDDSESD